MTNLPWESDLNLAHHIFIYSMTSLIWTHSFPPKIVCVWIIKTDSKPISIITTKISIRMLKQMSELLIKEVLLYTYDYNTPICLYIYHNTSHSISQIFTFILSSKTSLNSGFEFDDLKIAMRLSHGCCIAVCSWVAVCKECLPNYSFRNGGRPLHHFNSFLFWKIINMHDSCRKHCFMFIFKICIVNLHLTWHGVYIVLHFTLILLRIYSLIPSIPLSTNHWCWVAVQAMAVWFFLHVGSGAWLAAPVNYGRASH